MRTTAAWIVCFVLALTARPVQGADAEPPVFPGLDVAAVTEINLGYRVQGTHPVGGPHITFTPNAARACYELDIGTMAAMYVLRVADTGAGKVLSKSLVPTLFLPSAPSLSPDGKTLLLTGILEDAPKGENRGMWRTDLEGAAPVRITPNDYSAGSGIWRPDGGEIAFAKIVWKDPDHPAAGATRSVAFMDPRQPGVIAREIPVPGDTVGVIAYSPDARWLSVVRGNELGVMNLKTGRVHMLFNGAHTALGFSPTSHANILSYAAWLPDSERLLVTARDAQDKYGKRIWLVNLRGEARELTKGRLLWGRVDGRLLVINKDGHNWKVELR